MRSNFGKLGVICATAGSAVGLGNIWRFPTLAGKDGGSAFIIIYLLFALVLGLPAMLAEFTVGRHGGANAVRSYGKATGNRWLGFVGVMGVVSCVLILSFYSVVAGWCVYYLYAAIAGKVSGDVGYVQTFFSTLTADPVRPALMAVFFIIVTHLVVARGVKKGIEKVSNILMPMLFVLLVVLVVASCMLPGAWKGVEFLFRPDFSRLTPRLMLDAMGQVFFSLSLGTACLCTYASYFSGKTSLVGSAWKIIVIDCLIAILAGLMIFPAAFSVGINPDSGPSLIFMTLPVVFQKAFSSVPVVAYVISILFYGLLILAALTSTISMHEIGTAVISEETKCSRHWAAACVTAVCCVLGVLCSWSLGAHPDIAIGGKSLFDSFDFITGQILLPVGGFLTCLIVGWLMPVETVKDEFTNRGTLPSTFFRIYIWATRIICPVCIVLIFLNQFGVIEL